MVCIRPVLSATGGSAARQCRDKLVFPSQRRAKAIFGPSDEPVLNLSGTKI